MVLAAEHDRWVGNTERGRPRMDVLALHESGRLVIVELKRGESGRDVHGQAINYAALASKLTLDDLATAHQRFLSHRKDDTREEISHDEARARILRHVGGTLKSEQLQRPRIILVAGSYPQEVADSARFLTANGIDVALVQVQMWQIGEQRLAGFTTVYPVQDATTTRERRPSGRHTPTRSGPRTRGGVAQLATAAESRRPGRHTVSATPPSPTVGGAADGARNARTLRAG